MREVYSALHRMANQKRNKRGKKSLHKKARRKLEEKGTARQKASQKERLQKEHYGSCEKRKNTPGNNYFNLVPDLQLTEDQIIALNQGGNIIRIPIIYSIQIKYICIY